MIYLTLTHLDFDLSRRKDNKIFHPVSKALGNILKKENTKFAIKMYKLLHDV